MDNDMLLEKMLMSMVKSSH